MFIRHWDQLVSLCFHFRKLCRQTAEGSTRANILLTSFGTTFTFMKYFTVACFLSVGFFLVYPIKAYIYDKELVTLMPIQIILCDETTKLGYTLTNMWLATMGFLCGVASIHSDVSFIFFILNYNLGVYLIAEDLKDLQKPMPTAQRDLFLRNICKKRLDMNA